MIIHLYHRLFYFFLISLLVSCGQKPIDKTAIIFDKFPLEITGKERPFFTVGPGKHSRLLLFQDSILFIRQDPKHRQFHFSALNLSSRKLISDILPFGRKKGQSLQFMSTGIFGNRLWLHDYGKGSITYFLISDLLRSEYSSAEDHPISVKYYWLQPLTLDQILASGDHQSDHKLTVINSEKGSIERQIGGFPVNSTPFERSKYEAFLFLRPSRDKCVLASRFADRLELFDLKTYRSILIKGPLAFEPVMQKVAPGGQVIKAGVTDQTRYAFAGGYVTKRFIYLIYSGKTPSEPDHNFGDQIFIYDWSGSPIKKVRLERPISSIAVSSDDAVAYICDAHAGMIRTLEL